MFTILNGTKKSGQIIYRTEEFSFDTIGGEFSNTSVMINDVFLGINDCTNEIVQVWGLSPQAKWITMSCSLPHYIEGSIIVSNQRDLLHPIRVNGIMPWKEYYNPTTGWLCLDSGDSRFSKDICVCFVNNALALIKNGKMLSLWLKVK